MSTDARDQEAVLTHVRRIFDAYLARDRDEIRRLHTDDWTGLLGGSRRIERGIDDYMAHVDRSLAQYRGTGYQILESEVQVHGDRAVVFYIARYECLDADGTSRVLPLRSVDLYRRDSEGWNQYGSHIAVIPDVAEGNWGPDAASKHPRDGS